jgi:hypothetical protein
MRRARESELYAEVAAWLARHLKAKHPKARVAAYDTHSVDLSRFLRSENLHERFEDCDAYEIQVDVTGVVETRDSIMLAFVECKVGPITLRDVGQLLGYSLVARPEWSYLLSPQGLSERLSMLLLTFGRQDILFYGKNKHIRIAVWNSDRGEINLPTLVPKGSHI